MELGAMEEKEGIPRPRRHKKRSNQLAALLRWLHIYASMLGLGSVLLFSVTGVTLNHPDWFQGPEVERTATGQLPIDWLLAVPEEPRRLEIVEQLRQEHGINARLSEFSADDYQCVVAFAGPGYSADVFIDRVTGEYELHELALGWVAIANDLHKGRDTGVVWSVVIDATAILMIFISLTGLLLIFWIRRRRFSGVGIALVGTTLIVVLIVAFAA